MRTKKKRRQPTPEEWAQLAELGKMYTVLDPEFVEIKKTVSIPEIIDAVRAAKKNPKRQAGRPTGAKTPYWIKRFAEQKHRGLPYARLIQEFRRPGESLTKASMRLRKFCSDYQSAIHSAVRELIG
jgi:hypothetical protein